MEIVVVDPFVSDLFKSRCSNRPAKLAGAGKTEIIYQYNQDIGCAIRCLDLETGRRRGIAHIQFLVYGALGLRYWQHRTVQSGSRGCCK